MPPRRLLLINADTALAYVWQRGSLCFEQEFRPDEPGLVSFCNYLRQHPDCSFRLLADVAEESFQVASMPAVHGRDRRSLLARKRSEYCRGTPYATEIPLGREIQGRRDEIVLFTALTRHSLLTPWLQACEQSGARLAGLHSTPQLLDQLAHRMALGDGPHLLLSLGRAGFRQTYFDQCRLTLSRLSPLDESTPDARIARCAEETRKLIRHLTGQGLLKPDECLAATIVAASDEHALWRRHCTDSTQIRHTLADLGTLGKTCGSVSPSAYASCDLLLLHLLARTPPAQQFAPHAALRVHRIRLWQRTVNLASGAFLAASLLLAAAFTWRTWLLAEKTETLAAARRPVPRPDTTVEALAQALARVPAASPLPAWEHLSRVLDSDPDVELDRLDWQTGSDGRRQAITLEVQAHLTARSTAPATAVEALRSRLENPPWRAKLLSPIAGQQRTFSLRMEQRGD